MCHFRLLCESRGTREGGRVGDESSSELGPNHLGETLLQTRVRGTMARDCEAHARRREPRRPLQAPPEKPSPRAFSPWFVFFFMMHWTVTATRSTHGSP